MCINPIWIPKREGGFGLSSAKGRPIYDYVRDEHGNVVRKNVGVFAPCGNCPECFKSRQNKWVVRMILEEKYWRPKGFQPYFITLTYRDSDIPDCRDRALLDIQAFVKYLNRHLYGKQSFKDDFTGSKVFPSLRYYISQEFGDKTGRTHFHMVIFNVHRSIITKSFENLISDGWHRGFVDVAIATPRIYRYVTKYITKTSEAFVEPPYPPIHTYSRRPSLGFRYAYEHWRNWFNNSNYDGVHLDGYTFSVPRYLRDKLMTSYNIVRHREKTPEFERLSDDEISDIWSAYYREYAEQKHRKQVNQIKREILTFKRQKHDKHFSTRIGPEAKAFDI